MIKVQRRSEGIEFFRVRGKNPLVGAFNLFNGQTVVYEDINKPRVITFPVYDNKDIFAMSAWMFRSCVYTTEVEND